MLLDIDTRMFINKILKNKKVKVMPKHVLCKKVFKHFKSWSEVKAAFTFVRHLGHQQVLVQNYSESKDSTMKVNFQKIMKSHAYIFH